MTSRAGQKRDVIRRARDPDAKRGRRATLLAAAERLFAERELEGVAMADIARAAGLAKGTVYLYFPTKEAMFLELLTQVLAEWLAELEQALAAPPSSDRIAWWASLVARTLSERPLRLRLLALLHTVLERNLPHRTARAFKHRLAELMSGPAARLEAVMEGFVPGDGMRLLLRTHALTVGLAQMASPSKSVARVIAEDPKLAAFRIDFRSELERTLGAILRGWASDSEMPG